MFRILNFMLIQRKVNIKEFGYKRRFPLLIRSKVFQNLHKVTHNSFLGQFLWCKQSSLFTNVERYIIIVFQVLYLLKQVTEIMFHLNEVNTRHQLVVEPLHIPTFLFNQHAIGPKDPGHSFPSCRPSIYRNQVLIL